MKQLQSLKSDLHQSRIVLEQLGEDIQDGEVLLQVEKFSFTANNVTYGVAGDSIGYWNFFQLSIILKIHGAVYRSGVLLKS
jgi:hypothetical protein